MKNTRRLFRVLRVAYVESRVAHVESRAVHVESRAARVDARAVRVESAVFHCRDCVQDRPPCIPDNVLAKRAKMETDEKKRTERDLEIEQGDEYFLDLKSK